MFLKKNTKITNFSKKNPKCLGEDAPGELAHPQKNGAGAYMGVCVSFENKIYFCNQQELNTQPLDQ
jgi:hypothetical protein